MLVPESQDYWLDAGWGCGLVHVRDGKITGGAPIFRKLIGRRLDKLPYKTVPLKDQPKAS